MIFIKRLILSIIVAFGFCSTGLLKAQTAITTITATTASSVSSTKTVTSPADAVITPNKAYTVTYGTGNLEPLLSFAFGGNTYSNLIGPDTVILQRQFAGDEQLTLFYSRSSFNDGPTPGTIGIETTGVVAADSLYLLSALNTGLTNILSNVDDVTAGFISEIERVDYIWFQGIQTTEPTLSAFPIFDLDGNDNVAIAAITSLDANGEPASYGQIVGIGSNVWTGGNISIGDITVFRQETAALDNIPFQNFNGQLVEGMAVTFDDLDISANENFFGYSLFAADVVNGYTSGVLGPGPHTPAAGIDLVDISTFPDDTPRSIAGLDLIISASAGASVNDAVFETVGPGGYKEALKTWLKANDGTFVSNGGAASTEGNNVGFWEDQSASGYDFETLGTAPTFRSTTSSINFNPTVDFIDGGERGLDTPNNEDYNTIAANVGYEKKSITMAFRTGNDISIKQQLFEQGGGTNGLGIYIRNSRLHMSVWNRGNGNLEGDWNDSGNPASVETVSETLLIDTEYILTLEFNGDPTSSGSGSITGYLNGQQFAILNTPNGQNIGLLYRHTGAIGLGQHNGASLYDDNNSEGDAFYGELSEFIYCNEPTVFSSAQRLKIESYLAIKYGITLDQSSALNYVNSDGSIIFNTSISSTIGGYLEYNNDIAGIGRDDASELEQLKSKSENDNSILTIERVGSIANDNTWLIWGNDNASIAETDALTQPDTIVQRISRVWRIGETNDVGNTSVTFDLNALGLTSKAANELSLLVASNSSNADFSSATVISGGVIGGTDITFSGVNLEDGQYITLGTEFFTCAPGGVSEGITLWLRADEGAKNGGGLVTNGNIDEWENATSNASFAQITTGDQDPNKVQAGINYNPYIEFNGTNEDLVLDNVDADVLFSNQDNTVFFAFNQVTGGAGVVIGGWESDGGSAERLAYYEKAGGTSLRNDFIGGTNLVGTENIADRFVVATTLSDATNRTLFINGLQDAQEAAASFTAAGNQGDFALGSRPGPSNYTASQAGELIIFNDNLSPVDIRKVETYLAIKYGTTQNNSAGGEAGDYRGSNNNLLWDASANATYHNDVAGIGRDDASCFSQKQSKSSNANSIVSIGLGTIANSNAENANTFNNDGDYLIWGNDADNVDQANANTSDLPGNVTERIERIWRVGETGTVGPTTISFDLTGLGYGTTLSDFQLIVSNSPTMASGLTTPAASYDVLSNTVNFSNIDLTNGQYFTLGTARSACGPGGVSTGLQLWLQANSGTNTFVDGADLTSWNDQSGNNNNVSEVNQGGGTPEIPTFQSNVINFNPTARFTDPGNANNSYLETSANLVSADMTLISVFSTSQTDGTTEFWSSPALIGGESAGTLNDYALGLSGGRVHAKIAAGNGLGTRSPGGQLYSDALPHIATATRVQATSGALELFVDAANVASGTSDNVLLADPTEIGIGNHADPVTDAQFAGDIPEVIAYSSVISENDRNKIESYLAIKYGITKDVSDGDDGGTTFDERDYRRADETVIWNYDVQGPTYYNDIAGIGRDDDGCFVQKQSKSVNSDAILTIGLGTIATDNASNPNTFTDNGDYLIWGNDDGSTAEASKNTADLPGNVSERMTRVWKVQDTGGVGETEIQFDLTSTGFPTADATRYSLLVSNSPTMANATIITGGTFNGNELSFTGIDLTDGQYFTIGTDFETCGPGGVNTGIALWLAADKETFSDAGSTAAVNLDELQQWNDQSAPASNASEVDLGGAGPVLPVYRTEEFNFNPVIRFSDPNSTNASFMRNGSNSVADDMTLISVFKTGQSDGTANDFVNSPALIGADADASNNDYGLGIENGNVFIKANAAGTAFNAETTTAYNDDFIHIALATRDESSGDVEIFVDSESAASGTGATGTLSAPGNFGIANHSFPNIDAQFSGDIAESIVFNRVLNENERTRVDSYLAIKYGITRVVTGLSEAAEDYLAGDGGVIWDIDGQGITYHNDIFGIGRDDLSCFEQIKSKSENSDALVTFDNNGSFGSDDAWLISGNDNTPIEALQNFERPGSIKSRLNREWRVQETGTVGTIRLSYNLSTVTGPSGIGTNNLNQTRLMVDDDGNFGNGGTTLISPVAIDGSNNIVTFEVDFTSGQYYTLGSEEVAALPITLISFDANIIDENLVKLRWATSSESNNAYFTIERSHNKEDFQPIGTIAGAGNSNAIKSYEFLDLIPSEGINYYRLKQTDTNGTFSYSQVEALLLPKRRSLQLFLKKNPIQQGDQIELIHRATKASSLQILIFDTSGRLHYKKEVHVRADETSIRLPSQTLPSGLNFIKISSKEGISINLKLLVGQ